ncbi:MAG: ATP-binding protein, partial [Myxococcales bacterium]|nr:ATP-binding protein [Myxococcales bacterium]
MTRSSDFVAHFGLRASPFSKEVDDHELWLPETKATLVSEIEAALADHESVLIMGEPGVGKTCVLRALRNRLPQAGYRLTYCRNATLGRRDFYRYLCHALGLQPSSTAANLFLAVETHVQSLRREKLHPVFLLDEAHLLHPDMLAHLHILMNYAWDAKALPFAGPRRPPGARVEPRSARPSLAPHPHPLPLPRPASHGRGHRGVRALPSRRHRLRPPPLPRRRARRASRRLRRRPPRNRPPRHRGSPRRSE